jgi:glycosyltransferase involved in cell wall biosynthesis
VKVLVLNHTGAIGGASRSLDTVLGDLTASGCSPVVLNPPGPVARAWAAAGLTVLPWDPPLCPWLGRPLYSSGVFPFGLGAALALLRLPGRLAAARRRLEAVVRSERCAAVYVNSLTLFPLGSILARLRRREGVRVVWHVRELLNSALPAPMRRAVIRRLAAGCDQALAITSQEAEPLAHAVPVQVVHNTVPWAWRDEAGGMRDAECGAEDRISARAPASTPLRVIMAAALVAGKGIPDFVRMARRVHAAQPDVAFELFTTRPRLPRNRLDAVVWTVARHTNDTLPVLAESAWAARECLLDGFLRIRFDQGIGRRDYAGCSVYVRADETGCPWGRDIIEAMWAGVPVVATGESQEFVRDGETGFLVPAGRVDLLCERVTRILTSRDLAADMSKAARARGRALFSPEQHRRSIRAAFALPATGNGGTHA